MYLGSKMVGELGEPAASPVQGVLLAHARSQHTVRLFTARLQHKTCCINIITDVTFTQYQSVFSET
jgi:hypothetical protein